MVTIITAGFFVSVLLGVFSSFYAQLYVHQDSIPD